MKSIVILFAVIFGTCISCKELFDPKLEVANSPLVVDGLITNQAKPYYIKLNQSLPFDNNSVNIEYAGVSKATVSVYDNLGYVYYFKESDKNGVYMSDPSEFIGVPGRYYTLRIKIVDDIEYQSSPQLLLPNDFKVQASADYGTSDQSVDDGTGTFTRKTIPGTNIFFTIENNEDSVIRFRFEHKIFVEYGHPSPPCPSAEPLPDNNLINITSNYSTSTNNIEMNNVCFVPTYDVAKNKKCGYVFKFVTKIIQYRLNNETYQYYKNINTILAATGKIFDPISSQVNGNVKCISNEKSKVLGFFEASSARYSYYALYSFSKRLEDVTKDSPPDNDPGYLTDSLGFFVY